MQHSKWTLMLLMLMATACGFHTKDNKVLEVLPDIRTSDAPPAPPAETKDTSSQPTRLSSTDPEFKEVLNKIETGNVALAQNFELGNVVFSGIDLSSDPRLQPNLQINPPKKREMGGGELKLMEKVTTQKNFINLNCDEKNPNEWDASKVEGFTRSIAKVQNKNGFIHVHANKVFLCGKGIVSQRNVVVYANELVLNNTNFLFPKQPGVINICSQKMTLIGENKLVAQIQQPEGPAQPGSPILLTVLEEVHGDGTLSINQSKK